MLQAIRTIVLRSIFPVLFTIVSISCNKKQEINDDDDETVTGIALNEWKFAADSKQFKGGIRVSYFSPGIGLFIEGTTGPLKDTSLLLLIGFSGNEIQPGIYTTASLPNNSLFYMSDNNTRGIFDANPTNTYYGVITFRILNYNTTTNEVQGKFFGKSADKNLEISTITDGVFRAIVR
jgi:hypothetical protein